MVARGDPLARALTVTRWLSLLPKELADYVRSKAKISGQAVPGSITLASFSELIQEVTKELLKESRNHAFFLVSQRAKPDPVSKSGKGTAALPLVGGGVVKIPKVGKEGEGSGAADAVATAGKGNSYSSGNVRTGKPKPAAGAAGGGLAGCYNCKKGPPHEMHDCKEPCRFFRSSSGCNRGESCSLKH